MKTYLAADKIRALVGASAVGALAPTVFESVGASTHGFWPLHIFPSIFIKMMWKMLWIW